MQVEYLVAGVALIWFLVLSVGTFSILAFFRRLSKKAGEADIRKLLDKILAAETKNSEAIKDIWEEIGAVKQKDTLHVQKIGLVRFNPFKEIGGDHSFSVALLDENNTGIIITGLHTRERTRVYVKAVKGGKSEIELSEEEKKALLQAQKR